MREAQRNNHVFDLPRVASQGLGCLASGSDRSSSASRDSSNFKLKATVTSVTMFVRTPLVAGEVFRSRYSL